MKKIYLILIVSFCLASPCFAEENKAIEAFACVNKITKMSKEEFKELRERNECFLSHADLSAAIKESILWLETIRPLPINKNDKTEGTRLYEVMEHSLFRCLLFETGDVILDVNGEKTEPWQLMNFFTRLERGDSLVFKVNRANETVSYSCSMKE